MPDSARGRALVPPAADVKTSGAVVEDMGAILTYPVCGAGHRVGRVRSMLRVTGPGRAEVEPVPSHSPLDEHALSAALEAAFAGEVTTVGWWVPVGDWAARRTAWRLGFTYAGVLRGWADGADAWAFTLRGDDPRGPATRWLARPVIQGGGVTRRGGDPREPATRWLASPVIEGDGVRLRPLTDADVPRVVEGIGDEA